MWSVLSCLSDIEELAGNAWVPDTFCRKPRQTQDIASSSFTWAKILANGSEKAATYCFKKKNAETNYYHAMTFAACLPILGIEFSDRASDSHLEGLGFDPPYLQVHFFLHNCEPFLLCERWGCLMLIKNICSRQDSNLRFHRESHLCISANLWFELLHNHIKRKSKIFQGKFSFKYSLWMFVRIFLRGFFLKNCFTDFFSM